MSRWFKELKDDIRKIRAAFKEASVLATIVLLILILSFVAFAGLFWLSAGYVWRNAGVGAAAPALQVIWILMSGADAPQMAEATGALAREMGASPFMSILRLPLITAFFLITSAILAMRITATVGKAAKLLMEWKGFDWLERPWHVLTGKPWVKRYVFHQWIPTPAGKPPYFRYAKAPWIDLTLGIKEALPPLREFFQIPKKPILPLAKSSLEQAGRLAFMLLILWGIPWAISNTSPLREAFPQWTVTMITMVAACSLPNLILIGEEETASRLANPQSS